MTVVIAAVSIKTYIIVRNPQPENNGNSATFCATPTVNGLSIPPINPLPAPNMTTAAPVNAS